MHTPDYSSLLGLLPALSEPSKTYAFLTERHLQAIWFEQKYLLPLTTLHGEIIQVISPGIWNTAAGPDFLKAHLRIGNREIKGDIEIHLHNEGWYAHGHHLDPRYNEVVLHLVFSHASKPKPIVKMNGESVPSLFLENKLTVGLDQLLKGIDLENYPYKHLAANGYCSQALFKQLPEKDVQAFFTSAAYWRLEKKAEYLKYRVIEPSMQFSGGMVMALGYKHNAEAFLDLFNYLLPYRDLSEIELLALAFGCSGFFDGRQSKHWELSEYYQHLKTLWWERKGDVVHQAHLRLDRIRPLNHPLRRLVYLVKFLQSPHLEQLWQEMLELWLNSALEGIKLQKILLQAIPVFEDEYWNTHFTFEKEPVKKKLSLLGDNVKREMLLNAFLPLLYSYLLEKAEPMLLDKFRLFYQSFHASQTSKTEYLKQRFFANSSKGNVLNKAQIEQGAYQLHKDFCLHFEASCDGCPFVQRYLENNQLIIKRL